MHATDCLIPLGATPAQRCPYLPDRDASLFFYQPIFPSPDDFDRMLESGFRRHGGVFYRPACPDGCRECVPIRLPLARFEPSRSQRRLLRKYGDRYEVTAGEPAVEPDHLDLFNRHARHVSPDARPLGVEEYTDFLIASPVLTLQVSYHLDGELAGVGFLDVGHRASSSVYYFWDPDCAAASPGTFSALWEIDWCRRQGQDHYYLGYWIRDCRSMAYKDRFRPCERMDWESGRWVEAR